MSTSTLCRTRRQAVFADAEDHEGRRQRSGHWVAHERLQNGPEGEVPAAVLRAAPGQKGRAETMRKGGALARALPALRVQEKRRSGDQAFIRCGKRPRGEQDESVHVRCSVAVAA